MNLLLARLSGEAFQRLQAELEPVSLAPGAVIYEPGSHEDDLYFLTGGVVSLVEVTASGAAAEIAVVGKEGVLGIELFMGGKTAPCRMVARSAAEAVRLNADALQWQFARNPELRCLLLRYTQALMVQMSQTGVCNRHHSVEQQLCRWLLVTLDRIPAGQFVITQEQLAGLLGVRRESITEVAGRLQQAGSIRSRRGHIEVLERVGLEARVCECYGVVKQEFSRLLADVRTAQEVPSA